MSEITFDSETQHATFPSHLGDDVDDFVDIIHINDVYDVRQSPRAVRKIKHMRYKDTLTIFSGDFMGPSVLSDIVGGIQMVAAMIALKIDWSVLGNHEFDYGIRMFEKVNGLIQKGFSFETEADLQRNAVDETVRYYTNNKWLLCNFKYKDANVLKDKAFTSAKPYVHEKFPTDNEDMTKLMATIQPVPTDAKSGYKAPVSADLDPALLTKEKDPMGDPTLIPGGGFNYAARDVTSGRGKGSIRVCSFGLVDSEWVASSFTKGDPNLKYTDFKEAARTMSVYLKTHVKCELIFVISHMESKNDIAVLADTTNHVDFVFGGHDHLYYGKRVGDRVLLKSGMDFEQFSNVKMWFTTKKVDKVKGHNGEDLAPLDDTWVYPTGDAHQDALDDRYFFSLPRDGKFLNIYIRRHNVRANDYKNAALDQWIKKAVNPLISHLLVPVFHINNEIDTRETEIFFKESSIMSLFADMGRAYHGGDCAILYLRMMKGDKIFTGNTFLRLLDFKRLFPYEGDKYITVEMTGKEIIDAVADAMQYLAVAANGKHWIGVSGITFKYTPRTSSAAAKLVDNSVKINGKAVVADGKYKVITLTGMVNNNAKEWSLGNMAGKVYDASKQITPYKLFEYVSDLFASAKPDPVVLGRLDQLQRDQNDARRNPEEVKKEREAEAALVKSNAAERAKKEKEFADFQASDCKGKSLEQLAPVTPGGVYTDKCQQWLSKLTEEGQRKARFFSFGTDLKEGFTRKAMSVDFNKHFTARMTVSRVLI